MKTLLFLLLPVLPMLGVSQAPKGTNTILISPVSGDHIVKVLTERGYTISAAAYGVITTAPRKNENHCTIVLSFEIKDSTATLHGTYEGRPITPELWKHSESYGGHYKGGSFEIMNEVAKAIGPVEYQKRL